MIEEIKHNGEIIVIIVRSDFSNPGISFFTPDHFSQQLAYMQHPQGKIIQAHVHKDVQRSVHRTKEVLFIRKGKLRVDLYDDNQQYLASKILQAGDVILLAGGGHGFEILEDIEMIEVKQGPYSGDEDKTRFEGVRPKKVVIK